ncbi:MAG: hemerythrin domain-containing protein [Gammaproteobacteria bacterium]|nr:hemerythrin domain-containing protein [Gammaproteobacteria bacterium]MCW8841159.1 hemerythrin domain-containing protein [Gammaproteobacteria bacterium]MCW8958685.1 hemerythrin domain-containing protein [Gammaproteobacteria bacterium]MCW8973566.1 hemerythrin domain-containing protein [Gammaproteobacteria bacterium]MCW8993663.1 hemerythrin domain-containing protein [Gammaproteobacteria bacterium]
MKRSPGLRTLSSEHHTGLVMARRAIQAVEEGQVADAWQDLALRFEQELEPHFRQEEEQLLPALRQAGEEAIVQRTLEEHAALRALIHDRERDAEALKAFAELLKAHIRFEERELFAIAQARLPEFSL